ncbi:phage antirepressor N-terminal domain-containing protein [Neisseria shayeganii]|uniref:Phage antirepressor N-terminal domain-containing protein n=1 Tax=Neisseria shayeganii TaxID=607712 RepID=A0A7D7RM04_9NEIS|nr:phage antirepressor N-terminal domain-containing protein [Neisseria shayeganii]QMT39822.1 phage antirepressor N-terminal domain-containing protein [Neisseria shayeganii]
MPALITIPFYDRALTLIEHEGRPFVAMKPMVQGMGLDWKGQQAKLQNRFASVVVIISTTGADGKRYPMLCLPLEKLPAWLFTINPRKVKAEVREAVRQYQAECEAVLWQYWTTGIARRDEIKAKLAELAEVEAASAAVGSQAGKSLYIRKLEKQRNQALFAALQAQLPFAWQL